MATCQCLIIVALQVSICYLNTYQARMLPEPTTDSAMTASSTKSDYIPQQAADRLGRIKWENISFMGFQVWFLGMAFDAVSFSYNNCRMSHVFIKYYYRPSIKIQRRFLPWLF